MFSKMTNHIGCSSKALGRFCLLLIVSSMTYSCNEESSLGNDAGQYDYQAFAFQSAHHRFSEQVNAKTIRGTYNFPQDASQYGAVRMRIQLSCPEGGCGSESTMGYIEVLPDQSIPMEIGRYATPHGVGCEFDFDVSAYRDYLSGTVHLTSFMDVEDENGWILGADFLFSRASGGSPPGDGPEVLTLFSNHRVVHGDPNRPFDFPNFEFLTLRNRPIDDLFVRVIATGHGVGNTQGAARDLKVEHVLEVNHHRFTHTLWREDCLDNRCSPQAREWREPRAGWCDGKEVNPKDFSLTALLQFPTLTIDYQLETYENLCRQGSLVCAEFQCGSPDCNYDGIFHTEPHYDLTVQLIAVYGDHRF